MEKNYPGSPLFHMRMSPDLLAWFSDYAERIGKSKTTILREYLEQLRRQDQGVANIAEMRKVAVGAVRSKLRRQGADPGRLDGRDALLVLDDMSRLYPDLVASQYYATMTEEEARVFRTEWNKGKNA